VQQGRRAGAEGAQQTQQTQQTQQFPAAGGRFDGFGGPTGDGAAQGGYRSAAPEGNDFGQPGGNGFGHHNQER
jgi:hypothetical protein